MPACHAHLHQRWNAPSIQHLFLSGLLQGSIGRGIVLSATVSTALLIFSTACGRGRRCDPALYGQPPSLC